MFVVASTCPSVLEPTVGAVVTIFVGVAVAVDATGDVPKGVGLNQVLE